jgi:hypothetical protein
MAYNPLPQAPSRNAVQDEDGVNLSRIWDRWLNTLRDLQREHFTVSQELDVASVAANTSAEQTFTVAGLLTDMQISVSKPSVNAGLGVVNARVSAANTLALTFMNATGGAINPGAETYKIVGTRY